MGGIQRISNLNGQAQQDIGLDGFSRDAMLQGHAVQELHDDKGVAIPLAYVMNGAEVGMIERGRGARFAAKAFQRLTVPGQVIRKKLEGDKAAEVRVLGFVDHAIPPPNFSRMR